MLGQGLLDPRCSLPGRGDLLPLHAHKPTHRLDVAGLGAYHGICRAHRAKDASLACTIVSFVLASLFIVSVLRIRSVRFVGSSLLKDITPPSLQREEHERRLQASADKRHIFAYQGVDNTVSQSNMNLVGSDAPGDPGQLLKPHLFAHSYHAASFSEYCLNMWQCCFGLTPQRGLVRAHGDARVTAFGRCAIAPSAHPTQTREIK
jgi:hypothetical protein